MDDRIIDLNDYVRRRGEREEASSRRVFAVWGGDGERSRFALPLWRAAYLAGGTRAAIVWELHGGEAHLHPSVVLDLAVEPARTSFHGEAVADLRDENEPPAVGGRDGREVVVYLGEKGSRRWYMLITDLNTDAAPLTGRVREDVLFLAGECAGLLFHRDLGPADLDD